jgi:hypothetical protein
MLNQLVHSVTRLLPGAEPMRDAIEWADSDRSWHNSSHELSCGLNVIEHFELPAGFPDTMPAFHCPAATRALAR